MSAPARVRPPAVAGTFYPDRPAALLATIDQQLADARGPDLTIERARTRPKALVVPHAGYVYSGPVAARAYAAAETADPPYERVVLYGPAHYVPVAGLAVTSADAFATPLGLVRVDDDWRRVALGLPGVVVDDRAHAPEHSLEVQLPFLQRVLGDVAVLPLLVGRAAPDLVAAVMTVLWGGPETLVLVSTDLSHYLDYATARARDRRTADAVLARAPDRIADDDACGAHSLRGLLVAADEHALRLDLLDLRNSGDTAGSRDRVVGYSAFALEDGVSAMADALQLDDSARGTLLEIAASAIADALESGVPRVELPDSLDPLLLTPAATFVTLERGDALLGCIGALVAEQPLAADVAHHALQAAFADPRLPPVSTDDYVEMSIKVSVLSPLRLLDVGSIAAAVAAVRPFVDGVVVDAPGHRATLLPSVWPRLSDPREFLAVLWRKAGLRPGVWPARVTVSCYTTDEFAASGPRPAPPARASVAGHRHDR